MARLAHPLDKAAHFEFNTIINLMRVEIITLAVVLAFTTVHAFFKPYPASLSSIGKTHKAGLEQRMMMYQSVFADELNATISEE